MRIYRKNAIRALVFSSVFVLYCIVTTLTIGSACPIRILFGLPCPACGMTRACLAALTFDFAKAFYIHPLFILGVGSAAAGLILYIVKPDVLDSRAVTIAASCVVAAFIVLYVIRLALRPNTLMALEYSYDSLLGRIIRLIKNGI